MGTQKVVSRKTALGVIGLCIILSVVVTGVFMQNINANLQKQAASKDFTIKSLNSTVRSLNATVDNLNSTVNSLNAKIASLQKQVESQNSNNTQLQSSLLSADNEISAIQNEVANLQGEVSSAQAQETTLKNQIASDQSTITSLNTQLANVKSTIANWDAPVTDGFSVIQITDTQYLSESNPALFNTLTSWIINNTDALNVSMVVHTGDIVNIANSAAQWSNANDSMMQLYNNGVPYCWDAGNHDQLNSTTEGGGGDPNGAWLGGNYSAFNVTLMQQEPYWVSSIFDGANTAVKFSYGNYQFMVINIEYDANQTVLDWMETLLAANPTVNVIVATHNFLSGDGGYGYSLIHDSIEWAANFETILNNYPNVVLTLNGHDVNDGGTAYNRKVGNREEIFFNRQEVDGKTGATTARIYTFNMSNPAQPTVNVYTYQAYSNGTEGPQYLTDSLDQFSFSVNLASYSPIPVSFSSSSDFLGASGYSVSFTSPITLSPVLQNVEGTFLLNSWACYNQTGDLLRFYNLTFNGVTSNVTLSSVGANIVISNYDNNSIVYTVSGGNGTQTFLTNIPTSVTIDGGTPQTSQGTNWTYANGVVTVIGATKSVTINFT